MASLLYSNFHVTTEAHTISQLNDTGLLVHDYCNLVLGILVLGRGAFEAKAISYQGH